MIDAALDQMKDRSYVTQREFSDILLDMRLALMNQGEIDAVIQIEDDALVGADIGTGRSMDRLADRQVHNADAV